MEEVFTSAESKDRWTAGDPVLPHHKKVTINKNITRKRFPSSNSDSQSFLLANPFHNDQRLSEPLTFKYILSLAKII